MNGRLRSLNMTFGSVEEMGSTLSESIWSLDFRQLQKGAIKASVAACETPASFLMRMELDRGTHQVAQTSTELVSFGLPVAPQSPVSFHGRQTNSEVLTLFDAQSGVDAVSAADFSAYTVSLLRTDVQRRLQCLGLDQAITNDNANLDHRLLPTAQINHLRDLLNAILNISRGAQAPSGAAQRRQMDEDLADALLTAFCEGRQVARLAPSNRVRVVKRAMEYVRVHAQDIVSVEQLCAASACSLSTLERAFQGYYGVSPKQYLTAVRLSGVRTALLEPSDSRSIGDLASLWGFWHMSKFSADYKRQFGELPSATRKHAA